MLSPSELKQKLSDRNLKLVAEKTGVSYRTVRFLASGKAELVKLEAFEKLSNYFEKDGE
jgi:DNA-binding Xre family transcriptional regulator